jgi:phage gpG-like protein
MSDWPKTVREALKDPRVLNGIAQVAVSWMSQHIDDGRGRGKGGAVVPYAPLKAMTSRYWTKSRPKNATVARTRIRYRTVVRRHKGGLDPDQMVMDVQMRPYTEYQIVQTSYRAGGQPLRDTGDLYRSLGAGASATASQIKLTMQGNRYGLYHDRGFTTKGPIHFIPLTKKGRRGHATGADPSSEGLVRGKDYLTIGSKKKPKGVTVPARPFILPLKADVLDLGRSIYLGLRSILKRT